MTQPPKNITLSFSAYEELVSLAWCGVHNVSSGEEDMKRLGKHAEKMNPTYKTHQKDQRASRVRQEKQRLEEAKAFTKANRDKEFWYLPEASNTRVKVKVVEMKDGKVQAHILGPAESLPGARSFDSGFVRRTIGSVHAIDATKLTALDTQFGEPQQVKKVGVYEPGKGIVRDTSGVDVRTSQNIGGKEV